MRHIALILLFLFIIPVFSQKENTEKRICLNGAVFEKKDQLIVEHAIVKLLKVNDNTLIANSVTDEKGNFKLYVNKGNYLIQVSYIGFNDFLQKIEVNDKTISLDLGKIELVENSILLGEATIEAKTPDVVVKGDTIEFNAGAYMNDENDLLQDVIKNIAGVEIDKNGNITANGKSVQKILVDGKEFFGNDIILALNNLPANMIKKIQLYKEDSETAKITGFKDKDPEQVINLVVKEELKKSTFGNITGGYGSDERYNSKFNVNHMRGENQTSAYGNMNNVNNDGSDVSYAMAGIETNKSGGINTHITQSDKLKLGVNMRINDNRTIDKEYENSVLFNSEKGDYITKEENSNENKHKIWSGGLNLTWNPDSMTHIYLRTSLGVTESQSSFTRNRMSHYMNQADSVASSTDNNSSGDGFNIINTLVVGRKLNSKGRAVSASVNHSYRNDNSDGNNYSITKHIGTTKETVIDQKLKTESNSKSFNLSVNYVEPLGKNLLAQLSYTINNNDSERMRDTHRKDPEGNYTLIDTAYTRDTNNKYVNQNISLNLQLNKEKYRLSGGFSVDPTYSSSKISSPDTVVEMKQHVINISPNLNFNYTINPNASFNLNYSGTSYQPSLNQLSADTTRTATTKHVGNPNLKPSFENSLSFSFQKSDFESSRYLIVSGGLHQTINEIVDDIIIDSDLNSINTYQNVNGKMGANFGITYDSPLRNKKFSFTTSTNGNYYRNVGLMNTKKTITDNISIAENLSLRFKSKRFESRLQTSVSHTLVKNNLSERKDEATTNYGLSNSTYLKLPFDFTLQSDISYRYLDGYGADFKKNETLWNASISKAFLKKKAGTLKLQLYDILNDRNTLIRTISGSGITDSKSNTINRYFMFSFSYRFNFMKKGGNMAEENLEDEF